MYNTFNRRVRLAIVEKRRVRSSNGTKGRWIFHERRLLDQALYNSMLDFLSLKSQDAFDNGSSFDKTTLLPDYAIYCIIRLHNHMYVNLHQYLFLYQKTLLK